jgi:hypothetical protein
MLANPLQNQFPTAEVKFNIGLALAHKRSDWMVIG